MGRLAAAAFTGLALLAALVLGVTDYYDVLGISKDADDKAIKSAYRKAALKWHPDKNPDNREEAEQKFREVAEAYEVLSDPNRRKQYDAGGAGEGGFGGMPDFDFGFGGGFKDPNDLFKDMFGDKDPFASFDEFFSDVMEEDSGGSEEETARAEEELVSALSSLYTLAGLPDKASPDKIREVLSMGKWVKKEKKLVAALKKKYVEPKYTQAFERLDQAVKAVVEARGENLGGGGGGGGDPFGGFGGFGGFQDMASNLGKMMGGDMEGLFDMGGLEGYFSGIEDHFGGGGGGASFSSFSSSSFSSSGGGKTVKSETKVVNGKRVTKTIETDGETTKATMEEEAGGRVKRKTGVRRGANEQLDGGHSEM